MAGEHAEAYIATLVQERSMKLTGGLYHLTQVLMAYNTDRIEGSQLTEEQTSSLGFCVTLSGISRMCTAIFSLSTSRVEKQGPDIILTMVVTAGGE
ncbi:MAG: hypothetical protein FWG08_07270 [Propionibacteriaceae bacterium]|nr:hypothetical protein [Propionibacteriaceae bacterium]